MPINSTTGTRAGAEDFEDSAKVLSGMALVTRARLWLRAGPRYFWNIWVALLDSRIPGGAAAPYDEHNVK